MKLFTILCGTSVSQKSKMAVLKEEILISQLVYNVAAKFQRQHLCFPITMWCKRKSEIQNGGSKTGNTYISACIKHSYKIPKKATPMFSRSINSRKIFPILYDASESRKSKMVGLKKEILIAQHVYNIVAKFLRLWTCILMLRNSAEWFPILFNASEYQQSKMADHKLEILISQSIYNIADQFQGLYPCFQSPEIQWNYSSLCVMQKEGRNPIWRLTNKKYSCLWAAILNFWLIVHQRLLRIALMSSSSLKTWVLPLEFCSYDVYFLNFSCSLALRNIQNSVIQILNLENIYLVVGILQLYGTLYTSWECLRCQYFRCVGRHL